MVWIAKIPTMADPEPKTMKSLAWKCTSMGLYYFIYFFFFCLFYIFFVFVCQAARWLSLGVDPTGVVEEFEFGSDRRIRLTRRDYWFLALLALSFSCCFVLFYVLLSNQQSESMFHLAGCDVHCIPIGPSVSHCKGCESVRDQPKLTALSINLC